MTRLPLRESVARGTKVVGDDQIILGRAALLPSQDRDLVVAVWVNRQPTGLLARLGRTTPAAIRRRVRHLIRRLNSRDFLGAARVLRLLDPLQARVARLHFIEGLSQRATAEAAGLRYHRTRTLISEVRGAFRTAELSGAAARPARQSP